MIKDFIDFVEVIRKKTGLKVEDLCEGICDRRQYYRYVKKTNSPRTETLHSLILRLNITPDDFYNQYYTLFDTDRFDLIRLLGMLQISKIDEAEQKIKEFSRANTFQGVNRVIFHFCKSKHKYLTSGNLDLYMKDLSYIRSKFYNLKKDILSIIVEYEILQIGMSAKNLEIDLNNSAQNLEDFFTSADNYLIDNVTYHLIIPPILSLLSRYNGIKGNVEKAFDFAKKGIAYSLRNFTMYSLPNLYYKASYSALLLGKKQEWRDYALKCLYCCITTNKKQEFDQYLQVITDDTPDAKRMIWPHYE